MAVTTYGADGSVTKSPSPSASSTSSSSSVSDRLSALGSSYNNAMSNYSKTGDKSYLDAASNYHQAANQIRSQNGQSTYYDSITDHPGTGTTGTTSSGGSIASKMLSAAQNPTTETTNWNIRGTTLKTPVYNGRSVASMADLASSLGIQYTKDPSTGAITVNGNKVNPVGYDANGVPQVQVRQILNAMGVPDEQINYDQKTGNVSVQLPQPQQVPQIPYIQPQQIPNYLKYVGSQPQMGQYVNNTPFQEPNVSMYLNNLMPMQQSFTPDWNTYYQQAHAQFDPTINSDMQSLITKMNQDITSSDEKMNARGIFNSGLAQVNEDLIRGDSSNAISKVLATSQSNIAKVAQQLYTDAFDQYYKGNTMAIQNNQMWLNQAMNQDKQAYTQWLGQQNLSLDQYKAALTAWNDAATQGLKQAQMSMDNSQFYDKLNQTTALDNASNALKMYQFNHLSADQSANLAQKQYEFSNQSASQQATNKLELFKMLGYVQMPDGSVKPTEQTTKDQQDTAIKLAQTLGYYTTPDGKIVPTQQATYQNGMLQLDNNKLTAQIHQWAADNQLKSAQIGLDQQKLNEKSQYDQAMIDKASASAQDTSNRTQLEGLKAQMISVTDQMKAYQAAGKEPPQSLVDQYNRIMNSVDSITSKSSSANEPGPTRQDVGNDLPGFNDGSEGGGYQTAYNATKQALAEEDMPQSWLQPMLWIANHESGFDPNNQNHTSTAYGLYQFLNSTWADTGISKTSDPVMQARAAVRYIKQRYGTAQNAKDFWQQNSWY